jgi:hypothetical protein
MLYAIKESGRDAPDEQYLAHVVDGNGGPIHALLEAGFTPAGHVDIHRGDIDAVIDHMLKDGESEVRLQAFVFDRQAVGKLVPSLWTFVRQDRGLITRSDGAGDIRVLARDPARAPRRAGRAAQAQSSGTWLNLKRGGDAGVQWAVAGAPAVCPKATNGALCRARSRERLRLFAVSRRPWHALVSSCQFPDRPISSAAAQPSR